MKTLKKTICILLVLFMLAGAMPFAVFADDGESGDGEGDQPIVIGPGGGGGDQPYEPVDPDEASVVTFRGQDFALLNNDFYNVLYRKGTEYLILTRPNQDLSYTIGFGRDRTHIEVSEKRLSSPGHPVLLCPVPKEDGTSRPTEALKYRVIEAGDDDGWTDQSRYLEGIYDGGVETTDDFEDCPKFCFDWKNNLIAFYCVETGDHLCQNSGNFYFGGGDPKPEESDFFVYQRVCPHEHTVTCPYTAPTCAQPGNKAYKYCEDCGSVLSTGGKRTYTDGTGVKHYYDENYFKIDTTDHDFRNGVCIYCGKSVAPDTVMVADQEYKLISDDFYNKYYFNATEYIVVMYSGRQFYALTEGLESEIAKDRGSYLFFEAAASLVPETDPDIGMRRPNNTLFYKVGEKYLKTDSSGNISLVDTAEESGTKYYFDVEDGEAVFGAYLENYPANKYYIDIPTNGYCSFTGNKAQVLIYQKVCEHPNAEVCAASENSCTKAGMRYHIYCPDCDTYEDEAHSRTYTADDGTIYRYMSCEDFITKPLGHRYCKYHTCSRCGTKARKYVKVTSDEMIVPSPKYRYILVDEFSGKILAADVSKAFDNEAMTLTRDGLSDGYIVNTSDGASVMALEFCISPFVPEYPGMALPEDGTPLYTLISDTGYSILIQDELSIFYAPANGWSFKYPFGFFCDGENALLSSWNYGKWSEPAFNGESSFTLYRGEIEEDLGPVAEGEFEIEIEGGEAKFCGRNAAFAGSADLNDTLVITAYDYPGRTFKYWKTLGGETIPEREFKMLVRTDEKIWAVYEDASEFGAWTLVSDSTDCTVPKIFKQTNAEGDVRYKTVYVNGGFHSYGVAEPYDSEHHVSYCVFCGKPEYAEHSINEARMTVFPTHSSSGISVCTCKRCNK
ncbi:MAG: hypothetical protein II739_06565 [Clostridia bacterium]|nr:hypothetical protein [Clostridia bacterium]